MRPPQHDKTHGCADRNQDQSYQRQKRCEQEGNDNLRADDDHSRSELHHVMRRRADAVNVAAHEMGDARMLQARHYRPRCGAEASGEACADRLDEALSICASMMLRRATMIARMITSPAN